MIDEIVDENDEITYINSNGNETAALDFNLNASELIYSVKEHDKYQHIQKKCIILPKNKHKIRWDGFVTLVLVFISIALPL